MFENNKFRKVEVREASTRVLDLNIRIEHGMPDWYRFGGDDMDKLAVKITVIVCGRHGEIRFEDWISDTDPLEVSRHHDLLRFLSLGQCHDFEIVGPKASVKIRIRRNYHGWIFWDVIEKSVIRNGMRWPPQLSVAQ